MRQLKIAHDQSEGEVQMQDDKSNDAPITEDEDASHFPDSTDGTLGVMGFGDIALDGHMGGYAAWSEGYYEARKFKELPAEDQNELTKNIVMKLTEVIEQIDSADVKSNIPAIIGAHSDTLNNFLQEKASWKELCIGMEGLLDKIELEDLSVYQKSITLQINQVIEALREFFKQVDTGNRKEAEKFADKNAWG